MNIEYEPNNEHIIFLSSDESEDSTVKQKPIISNKIKNATTGLNINSNINTSNPIKNIIHHDSDNSDYSSDSSNKLDNGWNEEANNTINNWYNLFKQQSFIYQWVLERNKKISDKLMFASIIVSSSLGIFSSFKLWVKDEKFTTISDILLMLSNFSVALITSYSKSYIDDKRNELIKIYIDEVDELLGEISGQILKSPVYRMNANDFFRDHNYKYNKLITSLPNISIYELNESVKEYEIFKKHLIQNI